jgi:Linalool dehydratase/isomerase
MAIETPARTEPESTYLIPARPRPAGPLVAARLRRTAVGMAVVWLAGLLPLVLDWSPRWKAFGLGLLFPGAGFLYTSDPIFIVLTLAAFAVALVLWFGTGNILAPPFVWLAAALGAVARVHTGLWTWAEIAVPVALGALVVLGVIGRRVAFAAAQRRAGERNRYLEKVTALPVPAEAVPAIESSEEDLATARNLLDLALQPVDQFDGFDWVDQFQTAAVRYQLNFTAYALALMQQNRTPAFHGYLSEAQRELIAKMQDKRVWGFWKWENLWGNLDANPDPIPRDNIMFSAYLELMVGAYESNTGDTRYSEPGAFTFRVNDRKAFTYDFHTVTERVHTNFVRNPFGMFPCEPNWIYSACNTFGINTLLLHDRLYGTRYVDDVIDNFRHSMDVEFVTPDGRITAIRSSRLGLTIPMLTSTMADAGMAVFLAPSLPAVARRTWAIVREEFVSTAEDGSLELVLRGWDKLDVGNYRRSAVSPHAILTSAAQEHGDTAVVRALMASTDEKFQPVVNDGVRRYEKASTQANAMLALGRFNRERGFADLVTRGPSPATRTGPVLAEAPYPDVLVARATTDGTALELVLRPGADGGRQRLAVERLVPRSPYAVTGAVESEVVADDDGRALVTVDLDGRREVQLAPTGA